MSESQGDTPVRSLTAAATRIQRAAARVLASPTGTRQRPPVEGSALDMLSESLAAVPSPRVAVLVDRSARGAVPAVRRSLPAAAVSRFNAHDSQSDLHAALAAAGPFDAILDVTCRPAVRGRLFESTFFHLRRGGSYVVAAYLSQQRALDRSKSTKSLGALLARLEKARSVPARGASQKKQDLAALARAVGSVTSRGDDLLVVSRAAALAKLTEQETDAVLELRGSTDRVLHTIEATTFASSCSFRSSNGVRPAPMPDVYDAPAASLREYHQAVCVPGQVLTTGNLLLADSYRHNQRKRLTNRHTEELGRRFAALKQDVTDAPLLEGTYFYLDNEVRGHFGHAMTEQLSRLWALPLARAEAPDLKAVLAVNRRTELQPFELELYGAAGLAADELVLLEEPTRVERVLAATPMFSMPQYVHPAIRDTWQRVGDALASQATLRPEADRLFISRRIRKRACLNTGEVEEMFTSNGFEVVYPEDYTMADQVAMFRRAEVIAGFAGSGLFNLCFAPERKRVIMLAHAAYTATNEYLMASVLGHDLVSIVSELDRTEEDEARNVKRFQSSFTVDFAREGHYLTRVLRDL